MISEWSAAQHADFALTSAMSFASTRALQNLGAFVLRNHPLELHEQFILGRRPAWCAHKQGLDTGAGKLLDQQNLVRVSSAQAVGCVDKDSLDQAFGGKIAHTFKARADQARPAISVVLENPFSRYLELLLAGERDQRRRLACNRVLFPLFVGRYTSVDRSDLHRLSPSSSRHRQFGPDPEPECRKPV